MTENMPPDPELDLTEVLQALAHPATRHLIEQLAMQDRTKADIGRFLGLSAEAVGPALGILQTAGLVVLDKAKPGTTSVYCFEVRGLRAVRDWLDRIESVRRVRD